MGDGTGSASRRVWRGGGAVHASVGPRPGIMPYPFFAFGLTVWIFPVSSTVLTGKPRSRAIFTMFLVPGPPGRATTRSGLPSSSIRPASAGCA